MRKHQAHKHSYFCAEWHNYTADEQTRKHCQQAVGKGESASIRQHVPLCRGIQQEYRLQKHCSSGMAINRQWRFKRWASGEKTGQFIVFRIKCSHGCVVCGKAVQLSLFSSTHILSSRYSGNIRLSLIFQ